MHLRMRTTINSRRVYFMEIVSADQIFSIHIYCTCIAILIYISNLIKHPTIPALSYSSIDCIGFGFSLDY